MHSKHSQPALALKASKVWHAFAIALLLVNWLLVSTHCRAEMPGQVVATVNVLAQRGPIVYTSWPAEFKTDAGLYSWRTNALDPELGRNVYILTMTAGFPWEWKVGTTDQKADSVSVFTLTEWDYLTPNIDEIRIRLKVVSGQFKIAVGCIGLAFAPSDTYTDIRTVDESMEGWQTLRFSLNENLVRNFRRNDFTRKLPYITMTRWIQEPMQINVFRPGQGELRIDRVELVSLGQGRPYPTATPEQIVPVQRAVDFETPEDMASTFTFSTVRLDLAGPQPTNFAKPSQNSSGTIQVGGKPLQWYLPPRLSWDADSTNGVGSLRVSQTGYESFSFTGVRMPHPTGANAIQMTVRADHTSSLTNLVLDFLAYAAPPTSMASFPWAACKAPPAWLSDTNINYDLFMAETHTAKESYAMYHQRRTVTNHKWEKVLLPLEDFLGIYASNQGTNLLNNFQPLQSSNLLFLAFFSPYKQLKAETRIWVDDISLVRIDHPAAELRSFWQDPNFPDAILVPMPDYANYFGHVRQRDRTLEVPTVGVTYTSDIRRVSVGGPARQRYEIQSTQDLQQWRPVFTGYAGDFEDIYRFKEDQTARFFRALSE